MSGYSTLAKVVLTRTIICMVIVVLFIYAAGFLAGLMGNPSFFPLNVTYCSLYLGMFFAFGTSPGFARQIRDASSWGSFLNTTSIRNIRMITGILTAIIVVVLYILFIPSILGANFYPGPFWGIDIVFWEAFAFVFFAAYYYFLDFRIRE
jgi:hypothetical protein